MSTIHVCPLSQVELTIARIGAMDVVSLVTARGGSPLPPGLVSGRHLHLALSDISEPLEGYVLPAYSHVESLVAFVGSWDRRAPLVIHCYAGVSRSTAAAFIALCALDPGTAEADHATALRAASPTATPNPRLVALADAVLGRDGRMVTAVEGIGRGADCFEGTPCTLTVCGSLALDPALG